MSPYGRLLWAVLLVSTVAIVVWGGLRIEDEIDPRGNSAGSAERTDGLRSQPGGPGTAAPAVPMFQSGVSLRGALSG